MLYVKADLGESIHHVSKQQPDTVYYMGRKYRKITLPPPSPGLLGRKHRKIFPVVALLNARGLSKSPKYTCFSVIRAQISRLVSSPYLYSSIRHFNKQIVRRGLDGAERLPSMASRRRLQRSDSWCVVSVPHVSDPKSLWSTVEDPPGLETPAACSCAPALP